MYVAWSVFQGNGNNEIEFVRSTDHGATFSHADQDSEGSLDNQFADIAVTSDGTRLRRLERHHRQPGHGRSDRCST